MEDGQYITGPAHDAPDCRMAYKQLVPWFFGASKLRTMVMRMVAHDCADTSRGRARNMAKSRATQDSGHGVKVSAAAAMHSGNVDMASPYITYDFGIGSACNTAH